MTAALAAGTGRVTILNAVRSEWIKLRTVRSTWWALAATIVLVVGLGTLFGAVEANDYDNHPLVGPNGRPFVRTLEATAISLRGVHLAQLSVAVLGALVVTGEYATGMVLSTMSAIPRRWPVLVAKAVVFGLVALVVSAVSTLVAFLLGQQMLSSTHQQTTLGSPHAAASVFGTAVYLTLVALMAIGLGFLIRSTAGTIATVVGILLVLPLIVQALPGSLRTDIAKFLPLNILTQLMWAKPDPDLFGNGAGIALMALYSAAALVAGGVALLRRDV